MKYSLHQEGVEAKGQNFSFTNAHYNGATRFGRGVGII